MKLSRKLLLLSMTTPELGVMAANLQQATDFTKTPLSKLVKMSLVTSSQVEKIIIRSYIQKQFPNTREGYWAGAWLANHYGDSATSLNRLKLCYQIDAEFTPALILESGILEDNKGSGSVNRRIAVLRLILSKEPMLNDHYDVSDLYFMLVKTGRADAEEFLASWKRKIPNHFIFDVIKAKDERGKGNNLIAAQQLRVAISKRPTDFRTVKDYADLGLKILTNANSPAKDRLPYLQAVLDYIERRTVDARKSNAYAPGLDEAYLYLADWYKNEAKNNQAAFECCRKAFHTHPTAEAATKAFEYGSGSFPKEAEDYLVFASKALPKNYAILRLLCRHFTEFDPTSSIAYGEQSILCSPNDYEKVESTLSLEYAYDHNRERDRGFKLLSNVVTLVPSKADSVYQMMFRNRLRAGEFQAAGKILELLAKPLKDPNNSFFLPRTEQVQFHLSLRDRLNKPSLIEPLLKSWHDTFGPDFIKLTFVKESDDLDTKSKGSLAQALTILKSGPSLGWVLEVSVHSDSANDKASAKERMQSLREKLIESGLDHSRIIEVGRWAGSVGEYAIVRLRSKETQAKVVLSNVTIDQDMCLSPCGRYVITDAQVLDLATDSFVASFDHGRFFRFSQNGRYVAATTAWTDVADYPHYNRYVFQTSDWRLVYVDEDAAEPYRVAWSPDSSKVAFSSATGSIDILDIGTKKVIGRKRVSKTRSRFELLWSDDGAYIITGEAAGNELRVWDASSLRLVRELDGVSWPHGLGQTKGFTHLCCIDNSRNLTIWKTATWERVVQKSVPQIAQGYIPVHPDGKTMVLFDSFGGSSAKPVLINGQTGDAVTEIAEPSNTNGYAFSPDGSILYESRSGQILVRDSRTTEVQKIITSTAPKLKRLLHLTREGVLVSHDSEGIHVVSVRSGTRLHSWLGDYVQLVKLVDESGAEMLFAIAKVDDGNRVLRLNLDTFTYEDFVKVKAFRVEITIVKGVLVVVGSSADKDGFMQSDQGILVTYDFNTQQEISTFTFPLVTEYLQYGKVYNAGCTDVVPAPEGLAVMVSTYWQDGYGHTRTYSKQVRIIDLETGRVVKNQTFNQPVSRLISEAATHDVIVETSAGQYAFKTNELTSETKRRALSGQGQITLSNGDILLFGGLAVWKLAPSQSAVINVPPVVRTSNSIASVIALEDLNLLIVAETNNAVTYFNLNDFKRVLTIINQRNREWLAITPSGRYASSGDGTKCAKWSIGARMLPLETFRKDFENPTLVENLIRSAADSSIRVKQPEKIEPRVFSDVYGIELLSDDGVSTSAQEYELKVRVEKRTANAPDPVLVVTQNGRGINIEPSQQGQVLQQKVPLRDGQNEITFGFLVDRAVIQRQTIRITRQKVTSTSPKIDLWFLGIGINDYKSPDFNLEFAAKDILALESIMRSQKGTLYRNVNTKVMIDGQATNQSIKVALREFLGQAGSDDVVIIYLAGHGVMDTDQSLYYMTHDSDIKKPYSGTNIEDFNRLLQSRPAAQKAVLLMDICHAGAFGTGGRRRGGLTVEDAMKQLHEGTGTVVLASSTGRESSLEDNSYGGGHGAFTAAILEVIQQRSNSEPKLTKDDFPDGDFLTLGALQEYVVRRVPKITGGRQHPTTPKVEQLQDFPILSVVKG